MTLDSVSVTTEISSPPKSSLFLVLGTQVFRNGRGAFLTLLSFSRQLTGRLTAEVAAAIQPMVGKA